MTQPSRSWREDKDAADVFMPEVKKLMAGVLIVEPTVFEDQTQNTDLKVLTMQRTTIAVRVRDLKTFENERYRYEFTLRESRPTRVSTELDKVASGWGDWFFYGFGDKSTGRLIAYRIVNLEKFRGALVTHAPSIRYKAGVPNPDGTTFRAYESRSFPPGVIVRDYMTDEGKRLYPGLAKA